MVMLVWVMFVYTVDVFFERHENQKSQGENVRMKTKLSFRQCSCSVYIDRVCPCTG